MKVERVEPSKHKKGRVLVFLEDGSCLKITERELLTFSVRTGGELDTAELEALKDAAGVSNWKAKAAEMVSRQAMSRRALERKLREKGASESDAAYTADWLESIGALNDAAYAGALARHCAEKGYGPAKIRSKLYEKGVPKELWQDAMADLPVDPEQIDAFLKRKLRGSIPEAKEKRRLTAALLRRGFSWDDIKTAWSRYGEALETDEEPLEMDGETF